MNIKYKFLSIYLLISNIPLLIITIFTYSQYTNLINQQTSQMYENVIDKASTELNNTLSDIKHVTEIFQFYSETNESIVTDLKKYSSETYEYDAYTVFQSNNNIKFICQNLIFSNDYINGIFVFTPGGVTLGYGYGNNIDVRDTYDYRSSDWYLNAKDAEGKLLIGDLSQKEYLINSTPSISITQALYDVYSKEYLGVLLIDCSPKVFDLSNVNTLPETVMLSVENETGALLYSNIDDITMAKNTLLSDVVSSELAVNSLTMTSAINYEPLYDAFSFTRNILILFAVVCSLAIFILSIYLSDSLAKPIIFLSQLMSSHKSNRLKDNNKYLNRTDEIGILYNEYQNMITELELSIKNNFQNKLIALDAQMRALEAQINSHFLYNTLESINSIAEIEEIDEIATMSLALGNMFRYSIKTQSELVTIREELDHVKNYISIQKIRFDDMFTLTLEIQDGLYEYKVLKLILQPLVENALLHGLQYCNVGNEILISIHREYTNLTILIQDNGVGITAEKLAEINQILEEPAQFTELGHRTKQSIGLKNIHTRISLYYGDAYGLQVTNNEDRSGTTITLSLPIL